MSKVRQLQCIAAANLQIVSKIDRDPSINRPTQLPIYIHIIVYMIYLYDICVLFRCRNDCKAIPMKLKPSHIHRHQGFLLRANAKPQATIKCKLNLKIHSRTSRRPPTGAPTMTMVAMSPVLGKLAPRPRAPTRCHLFFISPRDATVSPSAKPMVRPSSKISGMLPYLAPTERCVRRGPERQALAGQITGRSPGEKS